MSTQQLTAVPKDVSNVTVSGRTVTWESSVPRVAIVSGSGLVSSIAAGVCRIYAKCDGKYGVSTCTVTGTAIATSNGDAIVSVTPAQDPDSFSDGSLHLAQGGAISVKITFVMMTSGTPFGGSLKFVMEDLPPGVTVTWPSGDTFTVPAISGYTNFVTCVLHAEAGAPLKTNTIPIRFFVQKAADPGAQYRSVEKNILIYG